MPLFIPPTVDEGPAGFGFFYRYKLSRGISVLKLSGSYVRKRVPSTDEIDASTEYYAGGHIYEVSEATKASLLAAGIGLTEANFE